MAELVIRLVFSLAVVLGLLMLCVRMAGRRFQGRGGAMVQVVHRQAISRSAAVSVVNVAGRVLVLGTTEHEVRLLTELDPEEPVAETALDDVVPALTVVRDGRVASPAAELLALEPQPHQSSGRHAASRRTPTPHKGGARAAEKPAAPLAGSVLSPSTWRQAWSAVSGRAS